MWPTSAAFDGFLIPAYFPPSRRFPSCFPVIAADKENSTGPFSTFVKRGFLAGLRGRTQNAPRSNLLPFVSVLSGTQVIALLLAGLSHPSLQSPCKEDESLPCGEGLKTEALETRY